METPLFTYTLRLADNALVLGHRLSEWCGHAPMLEALQQLFDAHAVDGQVAFEYQTRAFVGTLD